MTRKHYFVAATTAQQWGVIGVIFVILVIFMLAVLNSYGLLDYYTLHRASEPVLIIGTVVDAETGKPLNKAGIRWKPDSRTTITTTNKKGKFVVKHTESSWFQAIIDKPGYDWHEIDVPIHDPFGFKIVSGRRLGTIRLK